MELTRVFKPVHCVATSGWEASVVAIASGTGCKCSFRVLMSHVLIVRGSFHAFTSLGMYTLVPSVVETHPPVHTCSVATSEEAGFWF